MDPFDTDSLHPLWSPFDIAGDEAEADPDAHPPGFGQFRSKLGDEDFLFRGAQGDVDHVGLGFEKMLEDPIHGLGIFIEPEFGAAGSDDSQTWIVLFEDFGSLFSDTWIPTEKVERSLGFA